MAMILVTHDLGVVAGRADEIAVMYAGRVVEKAPTRTLFSSMRHPYTEALLQSIPKLAAPSHTRLSAIGGRPPDLVNPPKGCKFAPRCPYVQPKCIEEDPPLVAAADPGHSFRCWFPVGTPESRAAFEANRAAGVAAGDRRGGELMAGSGTAHLRPADETLLRVEDLVVEFPVGRSGAEGPRRLRGEHRRAARRDPRPRRRIRLRQVHDGQGRHAAAVGEVRLGAVRRQRTQRSVRARRSARCGPSCR